MDPSNTFASTQLPKMNRATPSMSSDVYAGSSDVPPENLITIIIGILSVLANGVLLYVMYKDPLKVFRTKISYLVACLGTADFLTALNGVLYGFLQPVQMYHVTLLYTIWLTVMVSVLVIFGMCVERWLAMVYPFQSNSICTKEVTLYFCIGVWIMSAALSTSIHFLPILMPFILSSFMEVLLFIIVTLYLVIFRNFKRAQRQTSAVEEVTQYPRKKTGEGSDKRATLKKSGSLETQLLIVVSILVLIVFVTFIPYNLATQIYYGYLLFGNTPPPAINVFRRYFFPFKFLNFLLNPFVYAWRLVQYRRSFAVVICNWGKKTMSTKNTVSPVTSRTRT